MPEGQVVHKTETPVTVESLQADFEVLGIEKGMTLLVHSSLSAMGWVCGGPVAVIIALQEVLGETGTLVMPTHSTDLSEPSQWENPPVPESWWQTIRDTQTIRPYISQNTGQTFQANASSERVPRSHRRVQGYGVPLKISM